MDAHDAYVAAHRFAKFTSIVPVPSEGTILWLSRPQGDKIAFYPARVIRVDPSPSAPRWYMQWVFLQEPDPVEPMSSLKTGVLSEAEGCRYLELARAAYGPHDADMVELGALADAATLGRLVQETELLLCLNPAPLAPFQCPSCDHAYPSRKGLLRHAREKHVAPLYEQWKASDVLVTHAQRLLRTAVDMEKKARAQLDAGNVQFRL